MNTEESLLRLKQLAAESEKIGSDFHISPPNSAIFRGVINPFDDEEIVVEADGFGGATLSIVEGNYPIDFLSLRETKFTSEHGAIAAAEQLVRHAA